MSPSSLSLSFGIELEMVFAFHEERLRAYLRRQLPTATIIKSVDANAPGLRQRGYDQLPYTSWALANAGPNFQTIEPLVDGYRAYYDEPLHLALDIARCACPGAYIHTETDHKKQTEFPDWAICNDRSLTGLSKGKLFDILPDRILSPRDAEMWDSWGVELVSPPYQDVKIAKERLSALVSTLRGSADDNFGATTTERCGLHIHVGLPDGSPIPLPTLQHLAYLLIVFEEEISSLHPGHRRSLDSTDIATNRENFYAECPEPQTITFTDSVSGLATTKKVEPIFRPLEEVRSLLFDTVAKSSDPLVRLNVLMGRTKGRIVNFSYLARKDGGPRTVEFRQHAGSLDADAIVWWIEFCTGLVRLAHDCAGRDSGERGGAEGCFVRSWEERICVEDLWEQMGFPVEGRDFYRRRIEEYAADPETPAPLGLWRDYEEFEEFGAFDEAIVLDS